ncbi:MAG: glycosyltransferase 87 family protein [Bacilli bacterium]|jgi:Gpi18-like mannosyltransferase
MKNKQKSPTCPPWIHKIRAKISNIYHVVDDFFHEIIINRWGFIILGLVFLIFAIILRLAFFPHISGDVYWYLKPWMLFYQDNGGLQAIGELPISYYQTPNKNIPYGGDISAYTVIGIVYGNYPLAYYNVLALLSYLPIDVVYLVKAFSTFFDIVLALGIAFIVYQLSNQNRLYTLIAWAIALILPTGWLNSSLWGQADGIYAALLVWCLYFVIREKPKTSMIFLGLALAFKVQTIFILPLFAWLYLKRKFKLYDLFIALGVVILTMIPAWIGGMAFLDPFKQYLSLAGTYSNPNMYSGSFYVLFDGISGAFGQNGLDIDIFGIPFALLVLLLSVYAIHKLEVPTSKENIILVAALFAILTPFVLPHMHERYFYLADFLVLLYVLIKRKRVYLAIFVQVASLITYSHFLLGGYIIPDLGRGTMLFAVGFNIAVIYFLFKDIVIEHRINKKSIPNQ